MGEVMELKLVVVNPRLGKVVSVVGDKETVLGYFSEMRGERLFRTAHSVMLGPEALREVANKLRK